jgi:hypothetical protein
MKDTMRVKAVWEFEVDTEDFDPKFVDIEGLAKDLTQREMEYLLEHKEISAEDFSYEVVEENNMKTVWFTVYKDTIRQHNDDWNLSDIQVTEEFSRQYFNECKVDSDCEWKTYEEFMDNYTADDTEDLYEYAKKHDAIIKIEHMED